MYCFQRCESVHARLGGGGGLHHLHFIILPLVQCPFEGEGVIHSPSHNTSTGHKSFPGGTPVTGPRSHPRGCTPVMGGGGGFPWPGQDGYASRQDAHQDKMHYPRPGQQSTCNAAGGMPLVVTQEDCLLVYYHSHPKG